MKIKIENNLSVNGYNNLRSRIGKDVEIVLNATKYANITKVKYNKRNFTRKRYICFR